MTTQLTVWFQRWWGLGLLILFVGALILLSIGPSCMDLCRP